MPLKRIRRVSAELQIDPTDNHVAQRLKSRPRGPLAYHTKFCVRETRAIRAYVSLSHCSLSPLPIHLSRLGGPPRHPQGMLNNRGGPAVVVGEGVVRVW